MSATETQVSERDKRRAWLASADAANWAAYAEACHSDASEDERQRLFEVALDSLHRLKDFDERHPAA